MASLARAQAELDARVTVVVPRDGAPIVEADIAPASVHAWDPASTTRVGSLRIRRLRRDDARALASLAPDVVHLHGAYEPDNWRVPRIFEAPTVLAPHGAFHPLVFASSRANNKRVHFTLAQRLLYRKLAAVHAVSPGEAADVVRVLPRTRVYCVLQGVSSAVERSVLQPEATTAGPVRAVFVGRIDVFTKGLDLLVEALALVEDERPGAVILRLVGPDARGGRAVLTELARSLDVDHLVSFAGEVDADHVARELAAADVYVQVSRHEAAPLSIAEALVAGKPALVSDSSGTVSVPELAALDQVRIVQADATAVAAELLALPERLPAMRAAARRDNAEVRRLLSWQRAAEAHLATYRTLVAERRRRI